MGITSPIQKMGVAGRSAHSAAGLLGAGGETPVKQGRGNHKAGTLLQISRPQGNPLHGQHLQRQRVEMI